MTPPEKETRLDKAALDDLLVSSAWRRDGDTILRTFTFKGFKDAIAFVDRVAAAASAMNHHPDIHVERYRHVRIVLTTHATGGISDADVELARRIEGLETPGATRP